MGGSASNKSSGNSTAKSESARRTNQTSRSRATQTREAKQANSGERALVGLQQSLGNRAVGQLLQANLNSAASAGVSRPEAAGGQLTSQGEGTRSNPAELITRAGAESGAPLDQALKSRMEDRLRVKLDGVRVYSGPASAAAAESIGAQAYTIGNRIHLGAGALSTSSNERDRLLAHEAVHTIQQGGQPVALQGRMKVSSPGDRFESEAENIAQDITRPASPALAMRDAFRNPRSGAAISRATAPVIQRHLEGKYRSKEGDFYLNLKTESHPGAKNGMSGTIKFKADNRAPDSTSIRLLQTLRDEDLSTGKEYKWTGTDADRNKTQTKANKSIGLDPGWHVDADPAIANPRTRKSDPDVSPYYRDYWPNNTQSQDGSKNGTNIQEASLWDSPGSWGKRRFSFETQAKDSNNGHYFGSVFWTFTISDPAKGTVEKENAYGRTVTLLDTDEAIKSFDKFYRNKGASTAPRK